MKYYGLEIRKFCGVDVSTSNIEIVPEFITSIINNNTLSMIAVVSNSDAERFISKFSKSISEKTNIVFNIVDTYSFINCVVNNKKLSPLIEMMDYDIN